MLIEKEGFLAAHQTGRNSGVIHSGIYYKPGSLKARFAKEGGKKLVEYCEQHDIAYDICGKLIVATDEKELAGLDNLYKRGLKNGLNIEVLNQAEMRKIEPNVNGISAIKVPMAGIVNYKKVTESLANDIISKGGELKFNTKVLDINEKGNEIEIVTNQGIFHTKYFINCAGLFSDRIYTTKPPVPSAKGPLAKTFPL
ncbi:FAD-dependent oxidoreductase [Peribacillus simplex]|uniref:FAD-dependent oxidoreductase n=1 Tax=Peribacillus simplex TaxID=1478 RepID=UPI003266A637